jgi:LAO/AO transport system kinase
VAGEPRAVARAMRLADDRSPEAAPLLKALWPRTGQARVIGVTGNPGAGKSTLCDRLITAYRAAGERVGVVAVDPSSPYTGGAILGDRIRMARHATDDGVFIRSLATRGHLGGLSRSAQDIVRVLDAAGYGVVLVETVGVGQDELEVTRVADSTLVVMAPGLGDEVQAIKAGLFECADAFAVNKADRDGADAVVRDLELMIALGGESMRALSSVRGHRTQPAEDGRARAAAGATAGAWVPPIVKCVATRGEGIADVMDALAAHKVWLDGTEAGRERRRQRLRTEVRESLRQALIDAAIADLGRQVEDAVQAVEDQACDPYTATETLVAAFRAGH